METENIFAQEECVTTIAVDKDRTYCVDTNNKYYFYDDISSEHFFYGEQISKKSVLPQTQLDDSDFAFLSIVIKDNSFDKLKVVTTVPGETTFLVFCIEDKPNVFYKMELNEFSSKLLNNTEFLNQFDNFEISTIATAHVSYFSKADDIEILTIY